MKSSTTIYSLAVLGLTLTAVSAEQFRDFTYEVTGHGDVTITDYSKDAIGHVDIPAEIDGKPVTSIGRRAFADCTALTSIVIPEGVIQIRAGAFVSCLSLTSIEVGARNPTYASVEGVLFDATLSTLLLYPAGRAGAYVIPPGVTTIGFDAFSDCRQLTRVSIPLSITTIQVDLRWAPTPSFLGCSALNSIEVHAENQVFSSVDGVLFETSPTRLYRCPPAIAGAYTVPENVTGIEGAAFTGCTGLTSVTIPSNVTSIGSGAFQDCWGMSAAIFLGDAPEFNENDCEEEMCPVFWGVAPNFTIYYLSGSTGFTSPFWSPPGGGGWRPLPIEANSYRTVMLEGAPDEKDTWLLGQGLPLATDLHQDLNNDGVSLLMAYALDLDPRQNLRSSLPTPMVDGDQLAIRFYGATSGITYKVQTSTDLQNWTTEGVTGSEPDPEGLRTATVPRDAPQRFLRLMVE